MRALFAVLLIGLAGCVSTKEEINKAGDVAFDCMARAARQLDDRLSDATAVAIGVVGACSSEIDESAAVAANGLNFRAYQTLKQRTREQSIKVATTLVLQGRAR